MQVKTTIPYHYITPRIAKIIKTDNTKCWWKCRVNENLELVQIKKCYKHWKTTWKFLKNKYTYSIRHRNPTLKTFTQGE